MSSLSRTVVGALSALVMVVAGLQASPAATAAGESVPDPATDTARFAPDAYVAPDADAATLAAVAADTNRPLMAVPFKCGQVWRGSAWTGHRPALAIDFNLYSGGDTDLGKPVMASAAGTVLATRRYSGTGYGQTVLIGHGNGYRSFYAHLKLGSVRVEVGDRIRADTIIARVGKSGGQGSAHLHYEQRRYSEVIPIKFGTSTWVSYPSVRSYKRIRMC